MELNDRLAGLETALNGRDGQKSKAIELAFRRSKSSSARARSCAWATTIPDRHDIDGIPTGSLSLDIALGIGGYPRGRIIEIFGPEVVRQDHPHPAHDRRSAEAGRHRRVHRRRARPRLAYARKLGVQHRRPAGLAARHRRAGPGDLRHAGALRRASTSSSSTRSRPSFPRAEIEGEMGDTHMGLQARLMSQALRKLTGTINAVEDARDLHQPDPQEDRRDVRQPRDHHRRQRAEVLLLGPHRHPPHRRDQGRRRRRSATALA